MDLDLRPALVAGESGPGTLAGDPVVLLAYGTVKACNQALTVLHRVAREIGRPGRVGCALWNFDSLGERLLMQIAAAEAAAADVVVIAAGGSGELPASAWGWIKSWLSTKTGKPVTLAAILDVDGSRHPNEQNLGHCLKAVAQCASIDFFVSEGEPLPGTDLAAGVARAIVRRSDVGKPESLSALPTSVEADQAADTSSLKSEHSAPRWHGCQEPQTEQAQQPMRIKSETKLPLNPDEAAGMSLRVAADEGQRILRDLENWVRAEDEFLSGDREKRDPPGNVNPPGTSLAE